MAHKPKSDSAVSDEVLEVFTHSMYEETRELYGRDKRPKWEDIDPRIRKNSAKEFLVPLTALKDAGLLKEQP